MLYFFYPVLSSSEFWLTVLLFFYPVLSSWLTFSLFFSQFSFLANGVTFFLASFIQLANGAAFFIQLANGPQLANDMTSLRKSPQLRSWLPFVAPKNNNLNTSGSTRGAWSISGHCWILWVKCSSSRTWHGLKEGIMLTQLTVPGTYSVETFRIVSLCFNSEVNVRRFCIP